MNRDAEACILSACMFSEEAVTKTIDKLTINDFTTIDHRNIFQSIDSLFAKNSKIDIITIMSEMTALGLKYDPAKIDQISDMVMLDNNVMSHIKIVKEHTLKQNAKKITAEINNKIGANKPIIETIDFARESFMNIDAEDNDFVFTSQEAVLGAMNQTQYIHTNKVQIGLQTDIYDLNKKVIFKPSDLVVIAAKKSVGKTVFLNQIAFFNARQGKKGVIINLEMRKEDIINREIARIGQIDYADISMGKMSAEQMVKYQEAGEKISKYPVIISTKRGLTVPQIHSKLLMFKNRLGSLDFVIIDYIQKIKTLRGHSRQRELADLSEELGTMAQHFDCPFFVGSQVNHEGITREAEDLENDADVVLKLRREVFEYKSKFIKTTKFPQLNGDDMPEDYATLQITKNRNGRTGGIELRSMLEFQRFENWHKVY